jgi:hypothetical protein
MKVFDKYPDIKELLRLRRYENGVKFIQSAAQRGADVKEITTFELEGMEPRSVYAVEFGNKKGKRISIAALNHGPEEAGMYAALSMLDQLMEPTEDQEFMLEKSRISIVPWLDSYGYELRGKFFVDENENMEYFPMDSGRNWFDPNGLWIWEEELLPKEMLDLRNYFDSFLHKKDGIMFNLHETVPEQLGARWDLRKNYGIGIIRNVPAGKEDFSEHMVANVRASLYLPYESKFFYYLLERFLPYPSQLKTAGRSVWDKGPLTEIINKFAMTLSQYLSEKHEIPAYTTETMLGPLDYRAGCQIAAVEGGIRPFLGYKGKISTRTDKIKFFELDEPLTEKNFYFHCGKIAKQELDENFRIRIMRDDFDVNFEKRVGKKMGTEELVVAWDDYSKIFFKHIPSIRRRILLTLGPFLLPQSILKKMNKKLKDTIMAIYVEDSYEEEQTL